MSFLLSEKESTRIEAIAKLPHFCFIQVATEAVCLAAEVVRNCDFQLPKNRSDF